MDRILHFPAPMQFAGVRFIAPALIPFLAACSSIEQGESKGFPTESLASTRALAPTAPAVDGIWISRPEISALPMSGEAWNNVKSYADQATGTPSLANQDDPVNVRVLAKALAYARTNTARYRDDVIAAITTITYNNTEAGGRTLALGRELGAYVIAAEIVGLPAALDADFRTFLAAVRNETLDTRTLISTHEDRPNNWGTHAGATRMAIARYLGDRTDLERAAAVFKGWLGDRSSYSGFSFGDTSWQCSPSAPVGINRQGCTITINGASRNVDGVLPDDQRRDAFTWPPPPENYVWEALQGAILQAEILSRAGYDVFNWENRALLRAYEWLHTDHDGSAGSAWPFYAQGEDNWQPHIVNYYYRTSFPAPSPTSPGKGLGFADWTHGPGRIPPASNCGNGTINTGEQCDGSALGGSTCVSLGYASGSLSCTPTCRYNVSQCVNAGPICGNGIIETGEQCDGSALNGRTCSSLGYSGGTLSCSSACTFNVSQCTNTVTPTPTASPAACGNGSVDSGEQCDGSNLAGETCLTLGFDGGSLSCSACKFSIGQCSYNIPGGGPVVGPTPPPNFKVAFLGDQGSNSNSIAVLNMIKAEGASMVLHQGDFDYNNNPSTWDTNINSTLGANFPYFASVGNHDTSSWSATGGYRQKLLERLARIPGASCSGDYGVNGSCTYQNLYFILSGAGTLGSGHESYIRSSLAATNHVWKICSWHKDQAAMQIGGKGDEAGWGPYEACRELGAIVATAHEHSYERTKNLTSMTNQTVDPSWSDPLHLRIAPGSTFAFVSGLGGESIRDQTRCLPATYPYGCKGEWAKIFTTTSPTSEGAPVDYGALLCSFNAGGRSDMASCQFKTKDRRVVDSFDIRSFLGQSSGSPVCGNGATESGEQCDGSDLHGATCTRLGYDSGSVSCNSSCRLVTSQCVINSTPGAVCGNNILEGTEQCDGTALAGRTCSSFGFNSGTLRCSSSCAFDTSGCSTITPTPAPCGNGVIDSGEQCDGNNLNGQTCVSRGFLSGTLACGSTCQFNTSQCSNTPPADTTPPTAPASLTAMPGVGQINLSWTASLDNVGVVGYRLYRKSGSSAFAVIANVTSRTYVDTDVSAGIVYTYQVTARDAASNESGPSPAVDAMVQNSQNQFPALSFTGRGGSSGQVIFSASASDPDGSISSCTVDFGDSTPSSACAASMPHTYVRGKYKACARAVDNQNAQTMSCLNVQINGALVVRIRVGGTTTSRGLSSYDLSLQLEEKASGSVLEAFFLAGESDAVVQTGEYHLSLSAGEATSFEVTHGIQRISARIQMNSDGSLEVLSASDPNAILIEDVSGSVPPPPVQARSNGGGFFGCNVPGDDVRGMTWLLLIVALGVALHHRRRPLRPSQVRPKKK